MIDAIICFCLLPIGLFAWRLMIMLGVLVVAEWTDTHSRRRDK